MATPKDVVALSSYRRSPSTTSSHSFEWSLENMMLAITAAFDCVCTTVSHNAA